MISIIVPVYKVEKYLPRCIESILNQTYKDLELILIDDGSPDNCPQICDEYAKKDSRIVVLHQKNKGVSAARNAGLKRARGEYIGFVDPDDWVKPEIYEGMLDAFKSADAYLVICGYNYYDEEGNIDQNRNYHARENEIITQKEIMRRFSDMPPSIRHGVWNKLFKHNLLHNMTFKEGLHSSEDVLFLNEFVQRIKSAAVVHKPYYCNTVRKGSATHGGLNTKALLDSFVVHEKMHMDSIRHYPELERHSLAFLMDVLILKYNEMRSREGCGVSERKTAKRYIRRYMWRALFDREIYWKTRIMYVITGIWS